MTFVLSKTIETNRDVHFGVRLAMALVFTVVNLNSPKIELEILNR